ncbi:hypothetical protein BDY24DRAFT_378204 [Mrakia frigida]|uniref:C48 family peptidase n=1 Tax=Mrakia frigida TaxID=29902 RepID=UPI003FCBFAE3
MLPSLSSSLPAPSSSSSSRRSYPSPSRSTSPNVPHPQAAWKPSSLSLPYSSHASSSRNPVQPPLPSPPSSLDSTSYYSNSTSLRPPSSRKERAPASLKFRTPQPRERSWVSQSGSLVGGGRPGGVDPALSASSTREDQLARSGRKKEKKKRPVSPLKAITSQFETYRRLNADNPEALASVDEKGFSHLLREVAKLRPDWDPSHTPSTSAAATSSSTSDDTKSLKASLSASQRRRHVDNEDLNRILDTSNRSLKASHREPIFLPEMDALKIQDLDADRLIKERLEKMASKVKKLPLKLTDAQNREVEAVIAKGKAHTSRCNREQVTYGDLERLFPRQWANDEIINYYGTMIQDASDARVAAAAKGEKLEDEPLSLHYFSTFFFAKLESPGYEKAKLSRWTKKVDIFTKDLVLIPINQGNQHWTSAVINFKQKRIEAYDSMGEGYAKNVFKMLKGYLQSESMDKKKVPFDFTGWEFYTDSRSTPQQLNGFDCGIFTCQILESVSRGLGHGKWSFGQENMPYLRRRMMLEIFRMKLLNNPTSAP